MPLRLDYSSLKIDGQRAMERICSFVASNVRSRRARGVTMVCRFETSSFVLASTLVQALGADRVLCLADAGDSGFPAIMKFRDRLGFSLEVVEADKLVEVFEASTKSSPNKGRERRPVLRRRLLMVAAQSFAENSNLLVAVNVNRTDLLIGAFDQRITSSCDLLPLAGLFRTQVDQVASPLDFDSYGLTSSPTDGASSRAGLGYPTLDLVLWGVVDQGMDRGKVASRLNIPAVAVNHVHHLHLLSESSRNFPPFPML